MKTLTFLKGMGLGAGLMYWFDPRLGRRRRALVQDRLVHFTHSASDFVDRGIRDLTNRIHGFMHDAACLFASDHADDRTIEERVRSKLGRYVSHPKAIEVSVRGGHVILGGPILAHETESLLAAAEAVRGVRSIESRLDVHEHPENIPSLQGGVEPGGERIDILQENWAPATRLVATGVGAALLANCLARRTPGAILMGTLGFGLFVRGTSNLPAARLVGLEEGRVKSFLETGKVQHDVERRIHAEA